MSRIRVPGPRGRARPAARRRRPPAGPPRRRAGVEQVVLDVEHPGPAAPDDPAAHHAHRLLGGRLVERGGGRRPPVDHQRLVVGVAQPEPADVADLAVGAGRGGRRPAPRTRRRAPAAVAPRGRPSRPARPANRASGPGPAGAPPAGSPRRSARSVSSRAYTRSTWRCSSAISACRVASDKSSLPGMSSGPYVWPARDHRKGTPRGSFDMWPRQHRLRAFLHGSRRRSGPSVHSYVVQDVEVTMPASADEFAERLFGATLNFVDVLAVFLGDRLGWYRALASGGPATPDELVARAGGSPRYAQEWLEQQAGTGILTVDARWPVRPAGRRRRGAHRRGQPVLPGAAGPDVRRGGRAAAGTGRARTATAAASAGPSSAWTCASRRPT